MKRVFIPHSEAALPAFPKGGRIQHYSGHSMGTSWQVRLLASPATALDWQNLIQHALDQVDAEMSHWRADSDLSRFNHAPAGSWHTLPPAMFTVLDYGIYLAQQTDGAFDPAIGKLAQLWGFGAHQESTAVPPDLQIQAVLHDANWRQIELKRSTQEAWQPGGVHLDFSGIAKGFAVDQVLLSLQQHGIAHALVEVGGELRSCGLKPDMQPWWVELEAAPGSALPANILALHECAVATSGDYRHYFEHDGQRYAHTIDPRHGKPVQHGVCSVTVIHQQCMMADALATALTVLGPEHGMQLAREFNLPALFVLRDGATWSELLSPALEAMLD